MRKRVYKFTSAKHGISVLKDRRLKVSTMDDLNDPFDLFAAIDTTDPRVAYAVTMLTTQMKDEVGLLCFSRNWDNLLLWSHYGNSHQGVCLGFDILQDPSGEDKCMDVLYQPNVLQIRGPEDVDFDLANRLLHTKHESWSYEQEVRVLVPRDPPDAKNFSWFDLGPALELKEVIIGAQCDPTMSKKLEEAVRPYGDAVKCWWAGMRPDAFLLVKQARPPHWHATVAT
jgi:Protein of unknown function (DUF2971)